MLELALRVEQVLLRSARLQLERDELVVQWRHEDDDLVVDHLANALEDVLLGGQRRDRARGPFGRSGEVVDELVDPGRGERTGPAPARNCFLVGRTSDVRPDDHQAAQHAMQVRDHLLVRQRLGDVLAERVQAAAKCQA